MEFSAQQIASVLNGTIEGNAEVLINTYAKIEEGKPGALAFLSNPKYEHYIYTTKASVVLVNNDFVAKENISATLIRVPNAYLALATLLQMVEQSKPKKTGIDKTARIEESAKIGQNVYIGAFVYIGENVVIGDNTEIHSHCAINDNVKIGNDCIIYNNAVIYHSCEINNNCIVHASSVIGADGFGFARDDNGQYMKMPQMGNVVLEDNVEVGACTTIDRASMGSTLIKKGAKIDNQIQIAHNVEVGEDTVMAAGSGVAGSTKIGQKCMFGGMVAIGGHLTIADGTMLTATTAVSNSIKETNAVYSSGMAAIPAAKHRRSYVVYRNLPELQKLVQNLKKQIDGLNK